MVGHGAVDGVALLGGEVLGDGVVAVIVVQVANNAGSTHHEQAHHQHNLLAPDFQPLALVVEHSIPVQDGSQEGEEEGQQDRFDGEHEQVLQDVGNLEHHIRLAQDHLVIQQHERCIEQDVDKQVNAEAAENHPGGSELDPVQKQCKNQTAADFRQNEREEIGTVGGQNAA